MADYFADSFAFAAFFEGNARYVRLLRRKKVITSAANLLELYGTLTRRVGRDEARELASAIVPLVVPIPIETVWTAGEFRLEMRRKKQHCSYIDAWGYAAAREFGIPFLTGDPAFRSLEGVEFVR